MTDDEMIAVIAEHKNGAKIQYRQLNLLAAVWRPVESPSWDFSAADYRVAPTPKLRPFTDDEAIQLLGAVAVAPDGKRGIVGQLYPGRVVVFGHGELELCKLAEEGWRWKWAHEDDCQLRPFGVVEGVQ